MDLTELKVETKEEVSSDFFDLKILTDGKNQPSTKKIKRDSDPVSVSCFVLLVDSKNMNVEGGSYNIDILGNSMQSYVVKACPTAPKCLKFNEAEDDILRTIKPHLTNSEYTLVLYSDTPLITRSNLLNILDFVNNKGLNVCKLTRGYVFKNEYIKRVDEIYAPSTYYFEEEDFLSAVTYKQLYLITEILKNRIINYHMQNGVYFKAPDNVYIDANVSIGKGTIIEPFVYLAKDTDIEEYVFIGAYSSLVNAKVFSGAKICGAKIDGAIVMENAKIKSGVKLFSQTAIKEGCEIGEDAIISNAIIDKHSMIGKNVIINYLNAGESVCIADNSKIIGTQDRPVTILKGASLGEMVTIKPGVKILEDAKIKMGEILGLGEGKWQN